MTDHANQNALLQAWRLTLERRGDEPAIWSSKREVLRTFAQIEEEARALTGRFAAMAGLPECSVVGVQVGNSERWPALLLALQRSRLVVLPLGRHMEHRELELALATCGAAVLVTLSGDELQFTRCDGSGSAALHRIDLAPDLLKLTSGTTSLPRAIRFRASHLVADCENICATMGLSGDDLNFGVIPFSHSYGFSNLLTPLLCRGIPLVASEDRMPRAILNDLASSGATVFPGMPVFFQKFIEMQNTPALLALRLCISAGAPLPAATAERFTARYGLKIHAFYGSSECGGAAYDATPNHAYEDGFVGDAMRGVAIDASEEPGPITVRSAAVGDGYFPMPDAAVLSEGRFVPGDLVARNPRGLYLVGRASDVINIAGRKLNPLEVEARLAEYPGVRQVVVFGVPSSLRGEEAVACVSGEGIDAGSVLRFCKDALSQWQMPRAVWVVSEIPANERGKINRRALAAEYLRTR